MRFSKAIVALVIVLNVAFAAVVLWLNASERVVSDALITAWFLFTGGELLALAAIKITEVTKENDESGEKEIKGFQ